MVWALILTNAAVFLLELTMPAPQLKQFMYLAGLVPARYTHPAWALGIGLRPDDYWPFLTSLFVHGGWWHILGNMWFLWIFGDAVEERMGAWRFLVFYLLCGLAAGLTNSLINADSTVPAIGASGAIAGVMGAYMILYPRARVVVLIPVFIIPFFFDLSAFFVIGFWFTLQLFSGMLALLGPASTGGIAWWAHVGGLVAGVLLCGLFIRRTGRPRPLYMDEHGIEGAWHRAW